MSLCIKEVHPHHTMDTLHAPHFQDSLETLLKPIPDHRHSPRHDQPHPHQERSSGAWPRSPPVGNLWLRHAAKGRVSSPAGKRPTKVREHEKLVCHQLHKPNPAAGSEWQPTTSVSKAVQPSPALPHTFPLRPHMLLKLSSE